MAGLNFHCGTFTVWPLIRVAESAVVRRIGYNARCQVLEVEFSSRASYRYQAVPAPIVATFVRAASKGRYFNRQIRNRYTYRRA